MNFKTTIVLLVLLAAVGVYLLVDRMGSDKGQAESDTPDDASKLIAFKPDAVTKITITPADGERVVLVKKDTKWRLQEPVDAPAKGYQVDGLVQSLLDLESRGQLEASAATGLDKPDYKIELVGKDAKAVSLSVGKKTAVGDVMYVRLEGRKRADIVSASAHEKLETPLAELREELLLNIPKDDIRQVAITRPEGKLSLQKVEGTWQITDPQKMPADSAAVDSLLFAITGLRAVEFVPATSEQIKTAQLDKPQVSVWVSTIVPTTQPSTGPATSPAGTAIVFGRFEDVRKQNVYASVSDTGQVATVSASSLDSFRKKPMELRDKTVVKIDPQTVSSITIGIDTPATTQPTTREAVKRDVKIERRKENLAAGPALPTTTDATTQPTTAEAAKPLTQWILTGGGDANDERVKTVVDTFSPLRADKFIEPSAPATQPVDQYTVTIVTQGAGGASTQEHQVRVIAQEGTGKPLVGSYNDLTFELPSTFAEKLTADFTAVSTAPAPGPTPVPAPAPAP